MKIVNIEGVVVGGSRRGRQAGFPTANINLSDNYKDLKDGVYKAKIFIGGFIYGGMANVGYHPTVGKSLERLLEVNIFDFNRDIYGENIKVALTDFIRPEMTFSSFEELIEQIAKDKEYIKSI